jgi:hypothetical protein
MADKRPRDGDEEEERSPKRPRLSDFGINVEDEALRLALDERFAPELRELAAKNAKLAELNTKLGEKNAELHRLQEAAKQAAAPAPSKNRRSRQQLRPFFRLSHTSLSACLLPLCFVLSYLPQITVA